MADPTAARARRGSLRAMATVRLDQQEPHAREFTATVIAHAAYAARPAVVLDRSAFYPEAGGQQSDRGALSSRGLVAEPPSIPAKPGSSLPPRRETGHGPKDSQTRVAARPHETGGRGRCRMLQ